MVGILVSFRDGLFSGVMLVSGRVKKNMFASSQILGCSFDGTNWSESMGSKISLRLLLRHIPIGFIGMVYLPTLIP